MANYNRLRIKSLKYISAVDRGAQGPISNVALIKRAPTGDEFEAVCKVVSTDAKLGIVFGWAVASTVDGGKTPHIDLQNDAVVGGDELIKIAADYVSAGAEADVMHDEGAGGEVGKVVFCLPLTDDVKKALGLTGDVEGLAIGMKPTEATFARYVSGELNAFSIGGTGEREPVTKAAAKKKPKRKKPPAMPVPDAAAYKRFTKIAVLTSVTDGHQHTVDLSEPAEGWCDSLSTSYQTAKGAEDGHTHAWVYDAAGKITIALDSGHTHTVDAVVPADVLAAAAAEEDEPPCAEPCAPTTPAPTVVVVTARAPGATDEGILTPSDPTATVKSHKEPTAMDLNERIRELEATNALLEKKSTLTDSQRAHFAKLSGSDATQFLNLAPPMRDAQLAEIAKSDEVIYTSPVDGAVYRKSDSVQILKLVQQADAATMAMRKAEERERITKFASLGDKTLTHFAKGVKGDLRGRLMEAIDKAFTVPAEHEEMVTALKSANYALEQLTIAKGVNPHQDAATDASPAAQLEQLVKRLQDEKSLTPAAAYDAVLSTSEGARLYAQIPVGRA